MAFSLRAAGANWCHDFPKLARESGFRFNRHGTRVRVDWKRISSIDIDRVISERDLSAIDDNVDNIVDCCLESEYDIKILDPNFVKLFRLAQLAIEYLLYCKQYLDHSVVILKDELRSKIKENAKLNNQARIDDDTVKELKDKLKERSRGTEPKLSDSHGEIHKCPQCPKTFVSSVFMSAHVNRRHSHNLSQLSAPVLDERYRAEAEKLHNEIKTLKERLNLTERLIRKESEKLLSNSDSIGASSANERKANSRDKDESRYQEEMKNFKETLFSEIRQENLKLVEKCCLGREETDNYSSANAKELIRQQENEIQRLRDQLYKRLTPDIEDIQVKLNNQEELWRTKIENLESRHRVDIDKLYSQLKITRESADRMRIDYIAKINNLERESRERKLISLPDDNVQSEGYVLPSERHGYDPRNSEDRGASADENIPLSVGSPSKNHLISRQKDYVNNRQVGDYLRDDLVANDRNRRSGRRLGGQTDIISVCNESHEASTTNGFDKNHLTNTLKAIDNPRQDAARVFDTSGVQAGGHQLKRSFATMRNVDRRSAMHRSVTNVPKRINNKSIREKLECSDSANESEASSSISSSESWLESPDASEAVVNSQRVNIEESRGSRIEVKSNNRNELLNRKRLIDNIYTRQRESEKSDTIEQLNSKLRDLGVDPEWQGIPKATLKQIMETVRHHRNLNCKKYRKLYEIRRELFEQVTRKVSSKRKIVYSHQERSPESPFSRFFTNFKGARAWKALSILDKNEGSHIVKSVSNNKTRRQSELTVKRIQRDLAENSNVIIEYEEPLRRDIKTKSPRKLTNSLRSEQKEIIKGIVRNNSVATRNQSNTCGDCTSDIKYLSHSYESLGGFHRQSEGANDPRQQQLRDVWEENINGTLVTSTPQRNEEVEKVAAVVEARVQSFTNDAASTIEMHHEEEQDEFFSKSPRNNRSVIKSASRGLAAGLVKKKVVFHLDNTPSPPDKDNNYGNTESDCEISRINNEINEKEADRDENQLGNIVLKSCQSEKIALISKQIEQQLSVARRKPVGSVEAMFVDKLGVTKDDRKSAVFPETAKTAKVISSDSGTFDLPQAAPRTFTRNFSSDLDYGSKDSNLDKDIDELLEIE